MFCGKPMVERKAAAKQPSKTPESDASAVSFRVRPDRICVETFRANNGSDDYVPVEKARTLEQQRDEASKSYQTVKDWAHRIENHLNTLLDRCSDYADGTQDATDLAKFCNEMIGLSNSIALGDIMTLRLQRDQLRAEVEALKCALNVVSTNFRQHMGTQHGHATDCDCSDCYEIDAAMKGAAK